MNDLQSADSPEAPRQSLSLMGVYAHPHDFTYTAGTLGHHVDRGDRVAVIFLTDGATTHNEQLYDEMRKPETERDPAVFGQTKAQYAARKIDEMRQACALFGIVDVTILPYADNCIHPDGAMIEQVVEMIRDRRPDIVITQRPQHTVRNQFRLPDDHFTTARVVHEAILRAALPVPGAAHRPHETPALYYIGVGSGWENIDLCVDVTDQFEKCVQAEAIYKTQGAAEEKARRKIEVLLGHYGWMARMRYAEPFIRANAEVGRYLTVNDQARNMAGESHMQRELRMAQFGGE